MWCPDCGLKNRDKAKFCANCGKLLSGGASVSSLPGGGRQVISSGSPPQNEVSPQIPSPPMHSISGTAIQGMLPVGIVLDNRYKITSHIATGGMGAVYKGEDSRMNTIVAVKEMLDFFSTQEEKRYALQRFREEALLLGSLRHPNIPRVTDNFVENGRYYLIMDFVNGKDTQTILDQLGAAVLQEIQVVKWAVQICDVLHYLHSCNPPIIYRDMKPSNIMICDGDQVMVVDFGIARHFTPRRPGTMIGTQGYAPPEQYKGDTEPRSDIYALAATLHHLITKNDPTKGVPFSFKPITELRKGLSPQLESILIKALNNKPEYRYVHAGEMKNDLEQLLEKLTSGVSAFSPFQGGEKNRGGKVLLQPSAGGSFQQSQQESLKLLFVKGKNYIDNRKYMQAAAELEKAVKLDPNHYGSLTFLGCALIEMGKSRDAVPYLQRAVLLKPSIPTAHHYLSKAYARLGKPLDSQREYQIAVSLQSQDDKKSGGKSLLEKIIRNLLT